MYKIYKTKLITENLIRLLIKTLLIFPLLMLTLITLPNKSYSTVFFQEDFESGDFSKWDFVWRDGQNTAETAEYGLDGQCITNGGIIKGVCSPSSISHTGSHAFQDHYAMNSSGAAHNDNNHMLLKKINNLNHFFIQGYLYFPTDIQWCGKTNAGGAGLQRKLIYFKGTSWDTDPNVFGFALGSWSNASCSGVDLRLGYGGHGGMTATLWNLAPLIAGQWYSIEVEIVFSNSVGQDTFRLWINGVLKAEYKNLIIRSQYDIDNNIGLGYIELGRQVDRYNSNAFDEYRYWDDIIISDTCNSCEQPTVQITNPTNSDTYTTTNTSINLSGTASDIVGTNIGVTSVAWSNDRGGSGTAWSGGSTQNLNWTASNIPLQSGQNIITVTATDGDGKTGTDTLVVTVTTSGGGGTGGNTGNSGGDASASGGSGCGFVKDINGKGQGAKGEGVALMILLIITLAGISLAKRVLDISIK